MGSKASYPPLSYEPHWAGHRIYWHTWIFLFSILLLTILCWSDNKNIYPNKTNERSIQNPSETYQRQTALAQTLTYTSTFLIIMLTMMMIIMLMLMKVIRVTTNLLSVAPELTQQGLTSGSWGARWNSPLVPCFPFLWQTSNHIPLWWSWNHIINQSDYSVEVKKPYYHSIRFHKSSLELISSFNQISWEVVRTAESST